MSSFPTGRGGRNEPYTERSLSGGASIFLYAPLGDREQGQNASGGGRPSFPWRYRQPAWRRRGYERGNYHVNTLTRGPYGVATRSPRGHAHQASIHRKRRHVHRALPTRHMPPLDEATWEIAAQWGKRCAGAVRRSRDGGRDAADICLVPYHLRQHRARRSRERHYQAYEEEYTS